MSGDYGENRRVYADGIRLAESAGKTVCNRVSPHSYYITATQEINRDATSATADFFERFNAHAHLRCREAVGRPLARS